MYTHECNRWFERAGGWKTVFEAATMRDEKAQFMHDKSVFLAFF